MKSKKDVRKCIGKRPQPRTNGDDLRRALNWILCERIFANIALHGNVKWSPIDLVRLAVVWVWSSELGLVEAFKDAKRIVTKLFGSNNIAVQSYQGLTNALVRYTAQLLPVFWDRFQALMQETDHAGYWRVGKWLALAVDGSRVNVPRTRRNEERFNKPKKRRGKKKSSASKRTRHAQCKRRASKKKRGYKPQAGSPQMWLTLVWHIGLRLPFCWKLGPSYSSERGHLQALLQERRFPKDTLFCCDAGFTGYDFWLAIIAQKHSFLIRVGSNVRLLRNLGVVRRKGDIIYCWPAPAMKKKQPPLVLRLFSFHDGRGEVHLVTNVLDDVDLTASEASLIYRRRWGVELQFRTLKQTYGRAKLRAGTPEIAEIELHWSLLGLTMMQLLALKEQTRTGEPTERTSMAMVLRIIRSMIKAPSEEREPVASLARQLANATTDSYVRHSKKKSRNYPRRKEEPSAGPPTVLMADCQQRKLAQQIWAAKAAA